MASNIDEDRLRTSEIVTRRITEKLGLKTLVFSSTDRREVLAGSDYVIFMMQVGGYKPSTVIDFEIPKKYGLRQTIADLLLLRETSPTSVDMKYSENIIKKIILEEQTVSLADIMIRRTGLGWADDRGEATADKVATLMAELKGWDEQRKEKEIQSFYQYIKEMHQVH